MPNMLSYAKVKVWSNPTLCHYKSFFSYHVHCVQNVPVTVGHDPHGNKEAGKEEEEDEGGIIGVFRGPVQRAAQLVDLQSVPVPAQQRSTSPCKWIEPDVGDGSPGPGEVYDLGMYHSNVAFICQGT